jgi:hypothetical protein
MAGHSPSKDGRSFERPKSRPSTSSSRSFVYGTLLAGLREAAPRGCATRSNCVGGTTARPSRTRGARRSQAEAHPRRRPERAFRGGINCLRSPKATSSISAAPDGLCARQFRDDAMVLRRGVHPYADAVLRDLTSSISAAVVPVPWRYETSAVLARDQNRGNAPPARSSPSWVVGQFE